MEVPTVLARREGGREEGKREQLADFEMPAPDSAGVGTELN